MIFVVLFVLSIPAFASEVKAVTSNDNLVLKGEFSADWVANQYISCITTNWNYDALLERMDPTIRVLFQPSQIEQVFHRYKLYGQSVSMGWPSASGRDSSVGTIWNCSAPVAFESGNTEVFLRLKETKDGQWLILTFSIFNSGIGGEGSESLSELSFEELKTRYKELTKESHKDRTMELKDHTDLLFLYTERLIEKGEILQASGVLRTYLQATPIDLENQLRLTRLLKGINEEERTMRLKHVYKYAENSEFISEAADALQLKPNFSMLTNSVEFCSDKEVDVILYPIGEIDKFIYHDVAVYLKENSGLNIVCSSERLELPKPQANYRDWLVEDMFLSLLSRIPERAYPVFCIQVGLDAQTDITQLNTNEKEQFIRDLWMMNENGKLQVARLDEELERVGKKSVYDAHSLARSFESFFPYKDRKALAYIGVCNNMLLIDKKRRPYGASSGAYGIISTHNFASAQTGESESRERLVARTGRQVLSTIGFSMGVPRCMTPDCARAYPKTLQFQDSKMAGYCDSCKSRMAERTSERKLMPTEAYGVAKKYKAQKKYKLVDEWVQLSLDSATTPGMRWSAKLLRAQCLCEQDRYLQAYEQGLEIVMEFSDDVRKDRDGVTGNILSNLVKDPAYSKAEKLKFFDQLLEVEPQNIVWVSGKTLYLCDIGELEEAHRLLETVTGTEKSSSRYWTAKLAYCQKTGDKIGLQESLNQMAKLNPKSEYIRYHHALSLKKSGRLDEADKEFMLLLTQNPNHEAALHNYAILLSNMKRYDEAIELEKRALKLDPNNLTSWSALGFTYYLKGELTKSIESYSKGIETLDGKIEAPTAGKNEVFYDKDGSPMKAGNKVALLFFNKALAHRKMGDLDLAGEAYIQALGLGFPRQKSFEKEIGLRVRSR